MLPDEARIENAPKGGTGYSGRSRGLPANDGSETANDAEGAVPKWDGGGYTPHCFAKSEKVAWNQWVAEGVF